MTTKKKSFTYHWGSGYVAEEARVEGEHHIPTLQLLKYTEGEAAGNVSGSFSRSPLMMSPGEIDMMRAALRETPELRELLIRLVGE